MTTVASVINAARQDLEREAEKLWDIYDETGLLDETCITRLVARTNTLRALAEKQKTTNPFHINAATIADVKEGAVLFSVGTGHIGHYELTEIASVKNGLHLTSSGEPFNLITYGIRPDNEGVWSPIVTFKDGRQAIQDVAMELAAIDTKGAKESLKALLSHRLR